MTSDVIKKKGQKSYVNSAKDCWLDNKTRGLQLDHRSVGTRQIGVSVTFS